LANVSVLYRHAILAKMLRVKVPMLGNVIELFRRDFGEVFEDADNTLAALDAWSKFEDTGFTFRQLNYLINDKDDPLHPLAPSQIKVLQISKTLYDGLNDIDHDHPDLPSDIPENKDAREAAATSDRVRAEAGLIFEPAVVDQIMSLLEGTTVY